MSSIVRRTLVPGRALVPRRDAVPPPRVLTLDADAALMLAVDATRGMLDACLRKPEPTHTASSVVAQAVASAADESPANALAPESAEACPTWRARQARRAYLSTLPPATDAAGPRRSCDRWA